MWASPDGAAMDLFTSISALANSNFSQIAVIAAIFTRISAFIFFLPGLGEQTISMRVRLMAALAITAVIVPAVIGRVTPPETVSAAALMIAAEAVAGALIGFSIRITIFAMQTAGSIISQSLSLAQLFNSGIDQQPETQVSMLLTFAAIVLAVTSGLHFQSISVLIMTYQYMPLGVFPGAGETGEWASERTALSFAAAVSLALPFVALGFVYNMAIGAANRAMPQLMVAFVGIPVITLMGLILLALSAPVILDAWISMVDDTLLTLMEGPP